MYLRSYTGVQFHICVLRYHVPGQMEGGAVSSLQLKCRTVERFLSKQKERYIIHRRLARWVYHRCLSREERKKEREKKERLPAR